ncbi:MAG: biliverdin-producing heme oxygenase [Proteobacteria bacterium]|nr:biliverdin-producing heme oxygenase [Pseudomonadota bacterium]
MRRATAELHAELDRLAMGFDLRREDHYATMLAQHGAALFQLEAELDANGAEHILPDWPQRRRSDALARDLAAFDLKAPRMAPVTGVMSRSWLYGTLYVLEGSRLGAEMLRRIVESSPSQKVRENCRYFSHGAGHPFWRSFVSGLETAEFLDMQDAENGAREAFARFLHACRHENTLLENVS